MPSLVGKELITHSGLLYGCEVSEAMLEVARPSRKIERRGCGTLSQHSHKTGARLEGLASKATLAEIEAPYTHGSPTNAQA